MKKPLYNIIIFVFHIVTILLLTVLCVHFGLFNFSFSPDLKKVLNSILQNDYFINIACTVFTAVALYVIQVQYSKHKLKNDFRCNEIIQDVFDGIENTYQLVKNAEYISKEVESLKGNPDIDVSARRKIESEKYVEFYIQHRPDFELSYSMLTYENNWILIDSIQAVFFINLNFKLLSIVNNIKNRKPNLTEKFPEINRFYEQYEKEQDENDLIALGSKIKYFLLDVDFMAKYWHALLNYLGYDPMPIKTYMIYFKAQYPSIEDVSAFFKLPVSKQNKISRKIHKKVAKEYLRYKIRNFFNV